MASLIKIDSIQSGPFTDSYRNVDFDIEAGNYDFSESYVNVYADILDTTPSFVAEVFLASSQDSNVSIFSSSLVENVSLDTELKGNAENIRKVNSLTQNLKEYTLSMAEKEALPTHDIYGYREPKAYLSTSICRQINRYGDVPSRTVQTPIRIDLKDILLGLGNVKSMPLDRLGKARLHLELQPTVVKPYYIDELNYQLVVLEDALKDATVVNVKVNGAADDENPNMTNDIIPPFFVGQLVVIPKGKDAVTDLSTTITSITWSNTNGWVLGIADPLGINIPAKTDILPYPGGNANLSLTFVRCELVLKKLPTKSNVPKLVYNTITTEESVGFPTGNYEKLFYLEPNAVNVMMMTLNANRDNLLSGKNIQTYRLRIDNEDLVTRDIDLDSPLHYDRLKAALVNAGLDLNNLQQQNYIPMTNGAATNTSIGTIMTPVPMTPNEKQFQVNFNVTTAAGRFILYKQVQREL